MAVYRPVRDVTNALFADEHMSRSMLIALCLYNLFVTYKSSLFARLGFYIFSAYSNFFLTRKYHIKVYKIKLITLLTTKLFIIYIFNLIVKCSIIGFTIFNYKFEFIIDNVYSCYENIRIYYSTIRIHKKGRCKYHIKYI